MNQLNTVDHWIITFLIVFNSIQLPLLLIWTDWQKWDWTNEWMWKGTSRYGTIFLWFDKVIHIDSVFCFVIDWFFFLLKFIWKRGEKKKSKEKKEKWYNITQNEWRQWQWRWLIDWFCSKKTLFKNHILKQYFLHPINPNIMIFDAIKRAQKSDDNQYANRSPLLSIWTTI